MKLDSFSIWAAANILLYGLTGIDIVKAQIAADGTLSTPTTVTTSNNLDFTIGDGSRVGTNLFHSFREFSIPTGGSASFNNAGDISNIISRVTGSNISNLDGLLQSNGTANLFLLNPNGIIFGPNARLDLGGSLIASTASSLLFRDGTQFNTTAEQTAPLLTVSVPIGLQFGNNPGSIVNRSQASTPGDVESALERPTGLLLQTGKTLAFVGGNVSLEEGYLNTPGGRIDIGSVAENSFVSLTPIDKGWMLGYENVQQFQDITMSQAIIEVTDVNPLLGIPEIGSGDVQIQGRQIRLTDGTEIASNNLGVLEGGTIALNSSESVELIGFLGEGFTNINTITGSSGKAGDISITTGRLIVRDGARIGTLSFPFFDDQGSSGDLTIQATESVEIIGSSPLTGSSILTVATQTDGEAGNLNINTPRLIVRDGARISAVTTSSGEGGTLSIVAPISVEISGSGIDVERTVTGGLTQKIVPSRLTAASTGSGKAGSLTMITDQLTVQNGAEVSVNSESEGLETPGNAGNLEIMARSILLDQGKLTAETASGEGGNINLLAQDLLLLRRSSQISTSAGNAQNGGNGGNITIETKFIIATPAENNNITANAFTGKGGMVNISAQGILGIAFRSKAIPEFNNITASSELGPQGSVAITQPDVTPQSGLVQLPEEVIDADQLVLQGCQRGGKLASGEFFITGRGGLPLDPIETVDTNTVLPDLGFPNPNLQQKYPSRSENRGQSSVMTEPLKESAPVIVEAQGWITDANGKVVLTTQVTTATPQSPGMTPATCYGSSANSSSALPPTRVSTIYAGDNH